MHAGNRGGGSFPGITTSAHATHNQEFIHAEDVGTDEEKLKKFVEAAVDAYYIDFIFRQCEFPDNISTLMTGAGVNLATTPVETIKGFIPLAASVPDVVMNIGTYCDYSKPFSEVFRSENAQEGEWESGSIYLFVIDSEGDDQRELLFHGSDETLEGEALRAVDAGGRDVADEIIKEVQDANGDGFVDYCWDDPSITEDDVDDNDPATAPGNSWKKVYVVNPFKLLGAPEPAGFSDVIFGSGIYPKTGTKPTGCEIYGGMEDPMDNTQEPMNQPEGMQMPTDPVSSVSGGGCAIASGSDGTPEGTAFNLLLLLSALFLAVSWRRCVTGRRNGVQS